MGSSPRGSRKAELIRVETAPKRCRCLEIYRIVNTSGLQARPDPSGSDLLTKLCFSQDASTQHSRLAAPLQEPPAAQWRVWDTFPDTDGLQLLLLRMRMCSPALPMSDWSGSRPAQLSGSDFESGCFSVHPALHLLPRQSLLASQFGFQQLLPPRRIHVCFLTQQTCSKHVGATFHAFYFQIISRFLQGEFGPILSHSWRP